MYFRSTLFLGKKLNTIKKHGILSTIFDVFTHEYWIVCLFIDLLCGSCEHYASSNETCHQLIRVSFHDHVDRSPTSHGNAH